VLGSISVPVDAIRALRLLLAQLRHIDLRLSLATVRLHVCICICGLVPASDSDPGSVCVAPSCQRFDTKIVWPTWLFKSDLY